ncbi:type I polyketide synthase [Streptomyces sp. NPDC001410]|uniref:type I polyketide synthase n=1 Tax=Streptomyces sp. NPDC001410 TaxID=3364574 RepID=UPI003683AC67
MTTVPDTTGSGNSGLHKALAALKELRGKIDSLEQAKREGIAIVGMGCRFPGGATSPDRYWQLLENSVDAITEVPASRWNLDDFYAADPDVPGRMPMRFGGFIDDVDLFDPYFFGISPREAARMDPQQRLFLQVAWEALEDAGQTRDGLKGSATGVYLATNCLDYLQMQMADPEDIDGYTITGGLNCVIPNRLSYLLDLRGPSLTVDTACSSSLVAVHLACQSLRSQECDMAVVGGVNLIMSPITTMTHVKGLPMAQDGRCKTFDARADGYVRAEGVGAVVLKRLSDAQAAGDRVVAVIRGTAVNQDGLTNGLTAPSGRAQELVIRRALENARLSPAQVTLVEAHGTGTELGDPIEVEALNEVYGGQNEAGDACALGAVKSNIGHTEAGAGIAGLMKVALSVQHRAIAPNLHFEQLNPHISLDGSRLFVPTKRLPWDVEEDRRHGAVSAFGAGGTNAHALIGPAPEAGPETRDDAGTGPVVIPVSARTARALTRTIEAYRDYLASPAGAAYPLRDIAFTAARRRTPHEHRAAVVAQTAEEAADRLSRWLADGAGPGVVTGRTSSEIGSGTVFVFPGQGSQRPGMGRELMEQCPVFRAAVTECDEAMRRWRTGSVIEEIHGFRGDELDRIDLIQPALFAIGVGLAARWRSLGVHPTAVVGHSMGEVAAAHVAGALSLDDAARIICRRSALLRKVSGQGAMLVVGLSMEDADKAIADCRDRVSVAVSNSPMSTVLSGDPATLNALAESLRDRNVFCRHVSVDVASHSPQMDPLRDELAAELAGLTPRRSTIPILSTVTGELCDGSGFDTDYWIRNLREPVLFWPAVRSLAEQGSGVFVELSPHPILLPAVEQGLARLGGEGVLLPSMRRDEPESYGMLEGRAALYAHGGRLPDDLVPATGHVVPLPAYAWQQERFWFHSRSGAEAAQAAPMRAATPSSSATASAQAPLEQPGGGLLTRLRAESAAVRRETMFAFVLDAVAEVLEYPPDRLDPRSGFFQLGMSSVLATQVRVRLEAGLERRLPAPVIFEYPTVESLADHLLTLVLPPEDSAKQPARPIGNPAPSRTEAISDGDIDTMSEDELIAFLAEEIGAPLARQGGSDEQHEG